MAEKKFHINVYYSTFCSYEITAKSEEEAWEQVNNLKIKPNEIISNLERWEEADTIEETL